MSCVTYPGRPGVPGTPAHVAIVPADGWNAGANNKFGHDVEGDATLKFNMSEPVAGSIAGIRNSRSSVGDPTKLQFAFMFQQQNGLNWYSIIERGVPRGGLRLRASGLDEEFEIRRVRNKVTYLVKQAGDPVGTTVYTSRTQSNGTLTASGCLYSALDSIG